MTAPGRIGLALGAGGARGWCHIGVLRELAAMGIVPDVIAGASMGALVGAAAAAGRLDALADFAQGLTRRRVLGLLDLRLDGGGIVGGAQILALLGELGLPERIEDLPVPFVAIATDLETGREIWLREGPLAEAVRGSIALPGALTPHRHDGRWLLDGGLVNPVPVSAARALGADIVIAANPNARLRGRFWRPGVGSEFTALTRGWADTLPDMPAGLARLLGRDQDAEDVPSYWEVVSLSIDIMTEQIRRSRLAGDPPHILLSADLEEMSVLSFHEAARAIEEGRRMTEAQREMLKNVAAAL